MFNNILKIHTRFKIYLWIESSLLDVPYTVFDVYCVQDVLCIELTRYCGE
ncbi:hypothetical protein [Ehrlichia muris]|uniref:Uncharacterized protein n=1 Tax=Ehrlichia muris AS145 TaxID=1423892 RepID=V9RA67_9RICK|nr:hypothetical protein [Ehrlichia muris]AHC39766.1 hypothetical protein EMUR_04530 [Ehrlichia muris AS145]